MEPELGFYCVHAAPTLANPLAQRSSEPSPHPAPTTPSGVTFDPDAAIQRVQERLIKRVSGAPWKGPSASA